MPTVRTIAHPPLSDSVTVHIPKEFQSCSLEIIIVPVENQAAKRMHDFSNLVANLEWRDDGVASSQPAHDECGNPPVAGKSPLFGALKGKIKYIAPDFDEPLEDFAEYM